MEVLEKVNIIERLKDFRYATKKFDPTRKLTEGQVEEVLNALNLTASSYGLQPYKFILVNDPLVREKLKAVSWGQSQITDASHLIVFAHQIQITDNDVDSYIDNIATMRNVPRESLAGFEGMMKNTVNNLSEQQAQIWMSRQVYIALGNLLTYCAIEGIDACPMEGFDADAYDEILGLKEKGLHAVAVTPIGFRAADDAYQFVKKVRKPLNEMVVTI